MAISYDPAKNQSNIALRGLSFELVAELDWASALIVEDTRKEYGERRFIAIGFIKDQLYSVVYTPRSATRRIISFRKASSREVVKYGQTLQAR